MFEDLQAWSFAAYLRTSVWLYPLVNTLHILGISCLLGSVIALDLRVAGLWRRIAVAPLAHVLVPVAVAGFLLAVVSGVLLFSVRATEYADLWLFRIKMGLLVVAVLNAAGFVALPAWRRLRAGESGAAPASLRVLALLSLAFWFGVLTLGRLVGYFT